MKNLVLRAMAVVAGCSAAAVAQEPSAESSLLREVRELRARVDAVEGENARLRGSLETKSSDDAIAAEINALAEQQGVTMRSVADPVTMIGEFRFRSAVSLGSNATVPGGSTTPPGPGQPSTFSPTDAEHDGWWTDALMRMGFLYDFGKNFSAYAESRAKWGFGQASGTSFPYGLNAGGGVDGGGGGGGGSQAGNPGGGAARVLDINTYVFLHQAWLEMREVLGAPELSVRVGRQEISLGNQFQFGAAEWFDGINFDALRFDWTDADFRVTGLAVKLQSIDQDGNQRNAFFNSHDDDDLVVLYGSYTGVVDHAFDLYWILMNGHGGADDGGAGSSIGALGNFVGDPAGTGGTAYFHTIGARAGGLFRDVAAGLDYNVEAAWQTGSGKGSPAAFPPGTAYDIDAFAAEAELGITFDAESKFRLYTRVLWAEGPSSEDAAYVPLYPSRHGASGFRARYGLFDLIPMTNVFSAQLGLHFDPAADWTLGATALWATTDRGGNTPGTPRNGSTFTANLPDDDYGVELDVFAEYRPGSQLVITAGLALLLPSAAGEALWLIDGDPHVFGYLQARLAF